MKNRGLQNRFPSEVRQVWLFWYDCMVCGRNRIDALHHIISPTLQCYVPGEHNRSVLNSCPIHNHGCHIGNDWWLHKPDNLIMLLNKTFNALVEMGYQLNENDMAYLHHYGKLYGRNLVYTIVQTSMA